MANGWSLIAKVFLESILPLDRASAKKTIAHEADETGILNLECQPQNIS